MLYDRLLVALPISTCCRLLEWDSDFFGFRIARVEGDRLSKNQLPAILDWCSAQQIRCLYLLAAAADQETAGVAADYQFRFVDIRTTLEADVGGAGSGSPNVRLATLDDIEPLAAIARTSHTDSRFYWDENFPREKCDLLYQTWIEKSIRGYAKAVLVAEQESKQAGYITCDWSGETGQIGLIAVADWARGKGLGGILVKSSVKLFKEQGMKRVIVVTQGRNVPAQRLYQHCGFLTSSVEIWYHAWFPLSPAMIAEGR